MDEHLLIYKVSNAFCCECYVCDAPGTGSDGDAHAGFHFGGELLLGKQGFNDSGYFLRLNFGPGKYLFYFKHFRDGLVTDQVCDKGSFSHE